MALLLLFLVIFQHLYLISCINIVHSDGMGSAGNTAEKNSNSNATLLSIRAGGQ